MERNRLLTIGLPLFLSFLHCILLIHPVQSFEKTKVISTREEPSPVYYQGVHGKPGLDFPVLTSIPKTSFSCKDIETGYYADLETNCQVFHICEDGKKTSFLCPNGTIFQQSDLICDWWFKVNCTSSPLLYEESSEQLKEELIRKKSARRITWKGSGKTEPDSSNPTKEFASTQNIFPVEDDKSKRYSKPNWSSVYNEPKWRNNQESKAKFIEDFDIRTNEEYHSTTEKIESTTYKQNGYKKVNIIRRKKPTEEPRQVTNPIKQTSYKDQFRNKPSKNEFDVTTEENFMTVTPETTTKIRTTSTYRNRFQYKDVQKTYSSTTRSDVKETSTTPSIVYNTKRRKEPITKTTTPKYENKQGTEGFDPNKYVNIFVGTRQKVLRTNNGRLSDRKKNQLKQQDTKTKTENEKKTLSTKYLRHESNVLSEDSDETQIPQETASIVDHNRYKNFNREKSGKTTYENHKSEYSEIKQPEYHNDRYFNNIVPVTSQYVTTQSFNNGKSFVGSSVGTPIPRNRTVSNIDDHNKKTFKLSVVAFNNAQALNPFENGNSVSNSYSFNTGTSPSYNKLPSETSTEPTFDSENRNERNEVSTEAFNIAALNPLNPDNKKTSDLSFEPKDDNKKDVLKHSTISLHTAQAYESLFNEETKPSAESNRDSESTTLTSSVPEVPQDTSPINPSNDAPFTSKRLEIPTTTEEPEADDVVDIKFNENQYRESSIPTKPAHTPMKPRPFELLSTEATSFDFRNDKSENLDDVLPYPFFQISTASPFSLREPGTQYDIDLRSTESPTTTPTDFHIKPDEVSVNNDIETEESSETFRPGLVVPSSVSPQTLHTLATYFENALNNMTSEERESLNADGDLDNVNMEEKLRILLSNMTRQKYEQLFGQMENKTEENTTLKDVDIEPTNHTEDPQKARKLAKLFSQALSEYLHDPANFKNRLIQVRPTEPPNHGNVFNTEKELLSFSEDDSKNTLASIYNSTWNFNDKNHNKTAVNSEETNNYLGTEGEGLTIADSQSFVSQFNNLNYEDKQRVGAENLPKNHWTSSPHATNLWRTTFAVDPFHLNTHFQVTESYFPATHPTTEVEATENYLDVESPASPEEEEIKYELRVFPKLSNNSSKLQGILIDFMNSSSSTEGERLHRILRKLNTTEDEFLDRMKKIEENPLTRRLILLLIHECEATKNEKEKLIPFLNQEKEKEDIFSTNPSSLGDDHVPSDKDQDARALQLLNSLYNIATKFGR